MSNIYYMEDSTRIFWHVLANIQKNNYLIAQHAGLMLHQANSGYIICKDVFKCS